ncbi:MAG: hypothetical protein EOP38_22795 [Rubrivivax sp.]|nr:MAG: hypothetical protein EOP38_22795 [Rubrivivax sp.]
MAGRLDFGFTFGPHTEGLPARAQHGEPFRVLVLGDFSGHGLTGAPHAKPLAQRTPQRVDIDNFDAVLARHAPRLSLPLGSARLELTFKSLDDFHPDQLVSRLPQPGAQVTAPQATAAPAPTASQEDDASTMERLLGRKPSVPAAATGLDALIKTIVAPHLVPDATVAGQAQRKAANDAALGELLRAVLHHPAFQALEAAWRGVHGLVRQLNLDEDLQLHLLDVTQAELQAEVAVAASTSLARCLQRQDDDQAPSWPLLVGLFDFGPSEADLSLLASLGEVARKLGGSFMASARPSVVGLTSFADAGDPSDWPGMDAEDQRRWDAFRRGPQAASVHLAAPRLLLRLPYGRVTDPVSAFAFEELLPTFDHDACLWGHGALAGAQLLGQAFLEHGWDLHLNESLDLEDLPACVVERDGDKQLLPCAEATLGERAGERLLALGLMPLLSYKHRNAVRVMSFQTMAPRA